MSTEVNITLPDNTDMSSPQVWKIVIMWTIPIAQLVTNIIVFIIAPRLHGVGNNLRYTMVSLAITDFVLGIESLSRMAYFLIQGRYHMEDNSIFCKWDGFANPFLASVSILTLAYVNFDKYLTLKYPLRYKVFMSKRRTVCVLTSIWITMLGLYICALLDASGVGCQFYKDAYICMAKLSTRLPFTIIAIICVQCLPSALIIISFIGIWQIIKNFRTPVIRRNTIKKIHSTNHKLSNRNSQTDLGINKTLLIMTFSFYIMWTPFFITVVFWELFTKNTLSPVTDFIFVWLGGSNSVFNPLVYFFTFRSYRRIFAIYFSPKNLTKSKISILNPSLNSQSQGDVFYIQKSMVIAEIKESMNKNIDSEVVHI